MARAALPLLILAGCNQIFGLEPIGAGDDGDVLRDGGGGDATDASPDANPDDVDGDGVGNGIDNCVVTPNATQDDEDADGIGDRCDPCPDLVGSGGENVDGDGVGDDCDYDRVGRQCIAWFDGFERDSLEHYRGGVTGHWVLDPTARALVQDQASALNTMLVTNQDFDEPWVRTSGTVLGRGTVPIGEPYAVGLWLRADPPSVSLPDGCIAALNQSDGAGEITGLYLRRVVNGIAGSLDGTQIGVELTGGAPFAIASDDAAGTVEANATLGAVTASVAALEVCRNRVGGAGFRTHRLAVQFFYLMVTAPSPACPPAPSPCACPPPPEL